MCVRVHVLCLREMEGRRNPHRDTDTDTDADTQTHRHTDTLTHMHTHKQTHRHTERPVAAIGQVQVVKATRLSPKP